MNAIEDAIKRGTELANAMKQKISLLETMQQHVKEMPENIEISIILEVLLIKINEIEQLHEVRQWLKKCFGDWKDEKKSIWFSHPHMLCSWKGSTKHINIWLETLPENFPKELQSEKCKIIKKKPIIQEQYAYVCEGK